MTNNVDVYKTFDRSTPAGRAMWALYNARGAEAEKLGNSYSAKNGHVVAARKQRMAEDPNYAAQVNAAQMAKLPQPKPRMVAGEGRIKVRVPKVGRRSRHAMGGCEATPGEPLADSRLGRRPAEQIKRETRRQELRHQQSMAFEAKRRAAHVRFSNHWLEYELCATSTL
eukprot:SAG31_NODE_6516_length_1990_cov_1.471179_3_plen_169_part_00